jgi:hypothetical protein
MKAIVSGICGSAVLAIGVVAFGQGAPPPQTPPAASPSADQQVIVTGCIQAGKGTGKEFVLTDVSGSAAAAPAPVGTTGSPASTRMTYELTGPNEAKAAEFVGKRVEIKGKLKKGEGQKPGELEAASILEMLSTDKCPAAK